MFSYITLQVIYAAEYLQRSLRFRWNVYVDSSTIIPQHVFCSTAARSHALSRACQWKRQWRVALFNAAAAAAPSVCRLRHRGHVSLTLNYTSTPFRIHN